jgi:hypothetical protein
MHGVNIKIAAGILKSHTYALLHCMDETQSGLMLEPVMHIQCVSFTAVLNAAVTEVPAVPANAGFMLDKAAVLRGVCTVSRDCCLMLRRRCAGCQVLRLGRGMAFQTLT